MMCRGVRGATIAASNDAEEIIAATRELLEAIVDANGIVHVTAKDKATNKEQQIRIQASGGLSDADIEQMVKDAEANKDADQKRRGAIEARNQAESMVHSVEKSMTELGDAVHQDQQPDREAQDEPALVVAGARGNGGGGHRILLVWSSFRRTDAPASVRPRDVRAHRGAASAGGNCGRGLDCEKDRQSNRTVS